MRLNSKYLIPFFIFWGGMFLVLQTKAESDTTSISLLLKESTRLQNINADSCFILAEKAFRQSKLLNYKRGIRGACLRMGSVMLIKSYNDSAIGYIDQALQISKELNDNKGLASGYLLKCYAYDAKGTQDSAFGAVFEGLRIAQLANDSGLLIQGRTTLADMYYEYGDYTLALQQYKTALYLSRTAGNSNAEIASLMGIGNVYYRLTNISEALVYYTLVDIETRRTGDVLGMAQNLNNLALCYAEMKKPEKALEYYLSALTHYKQLGMQYEEANLYYNLGILYNELNTHAKALSYFEKGLALARKLGDLNKVMSCLKELSATHAKQRSYESAYQLHVAYSDLHDSLLTGEKIASISEMQTKYETEKKEREIALLNEQNKSRSMQRNVLIAGTVALLIFLVIVMRQRNKVSRERLRSDKLLLNILPSEVAEELKHTGTSRARNYENVTVMFTDFVNFTAISEKLSPSELVAEIHQNFTAFDQIIERHGLEKVKTIGDAYLAVAGLPVETPDHAVRMLKAAQEIRDFIKAREGKFQIRIGIHSGPVVAGIVGIRKYAYDIWGDTVNTAARMEQHSEAGKINVSGTTCQLVRDHFKFEYRGKVKAKNKGEIDMYFLTS